MPNRKHMLALLIVVGCITTQLTFLYFENLPERKLTQELKDYLALHGEDTIPVIIETTTLPDLSLQYEAQSIVNILYVKSSLNLICGEVKGFLIEKLAEKKWVKRLWLDIEIKQIKPEYSIQYTPEGRRAMLLSLDTVKRLIDCDVEVGSYPVRIAVMDTGIDSDHPSFDMIYQGYSGYTSGEDAFGHGTHIAGIIISSGRGFSDVFKTYGFKESDFEGIAYSDNIMVYNIRVLGDDGTGNMTDIIEGIDWCEKNNIDIISCSFGAQIESDYLDPLSMAVNEASNKYGIVCVVAVGNTGTNLVLSPGRAKEALTVGAYDLDLEVCDFSAYNHEGKPDVVAPGYLVISSLAHDSHISKNRSDMGNVYTYYFGTKENPEEYIALSGTSMATPVVTGAVALLLSYNSSLTPHQVKELLTSTAKKIDNIEEYRQGAGSIQVNEAYSKLGEVPEDNGKPCASILLIIPLMGVVIFYGRNYNANA